MKSTASPNNNDSYFDGGYFAYLGLSLLVGLLSTLTLGIAYPWLFCMKERWAAKHTVICGKRTVFDGSGGALIGRYLLWWLLTVITFGIYGFWMSIALKKWITRHTHFVGEKDQNSFFDGGVWGYIGISLLMFLVRLVPIVGFAWAEKLYLEWLTKHSVIDSRRLVFVGETGELFLKYLLWGFLSVITLGIFALFVPVNFVRWQTAKTLDEEHTPQAMAQQTANAAAVSAESVRRQNCRTQAEMEIVKAGVTDVTPRETLEALCKQSAAAKFAFVTRYADEQYASEPFFSLLKAAAQEGYPPAKALMAEKGLCESEALAEQYEREAAENGIPGAMLSYMRRLSDRALRPETQSIESLQSALYAFDLVRLNKLDFTPADLQVSEQCRLALRRLQCRGQEETMSVGKIIAIILGAVALIALIGTLVFYIVSVLPGIEPRQNTQNIRSVQML